MGNASSRSGDEAWTALSHSITRAKAARLRHAQPDGAAAGAEELARVVAEMSEVLGAEHQQTRRYADVLAAMRT